MAVMGLGAVVAFAAIGYRNDARAQDDAAAQETAEMFHVSRVGRSGAVETRELLGTIYTDVAATYDEALEQARAKSGGNQTFKGERIRILRALKGKGEAGKLYLCAYNGTPSVFAVPGDAMPGGELSPPLVKITASGEHSTEIVRTVVDPNANKGREPALQKVDPSTGSGVTFFGIPLDTGSSSSSSDSGSSSSQAGTRQVRETRTLPLYTAAVSTELLEEGPPPMSQQLFLSMLKNGEVFSVEHLELRRCQECRGFGRIPDKIRPPGKREPDGKIACPECQAVGKIYWNVTYKVGW